MTETTTTTKAKAATAKTTEFTEAVRGEVISGVKQTQEFTLEAVSTWVDAIGKVIPQSPSLPFVPSRTEVIESVGAFFGAAEELLTLQRKFASDLVSALIPAS